MKLPSIGQIAKQTGVAASAIRYYESEGLLRTPARVNGRRVYDATTIRRIDLLRFAQEAGFTLDEIKVLFNGFEARTSLSARWQKMARKKIEELDSLARKVERMKAALKLGLECGCLRIEDCTLTPEDAANPDAARAKGGCSC
ncbi:MAG TPA: MerR family transcriptional regulator [Steroidobacteraceae bacterium]|nr:MerR family transcriptional regulator [Steroidobacteraceae bacterium]